MLQFQNPAVLWALAGLALPVLVHLIHRRPALRWRFPSLRFITAAPLPRKGSRKLRDPLLLLLRILFYAAIILLAAGPEWQPSATADPEPGGEHILVVDLSASMAGWEAWDQAQAEALAILREHRHNPVGLVLFSDTVMEAIPPTREHGAIADRIADAQPTTFRSRPERALQEAQSMFSGTPRTMHLFSDFQTASWEDLNWPDTQGTRVRFHAAGVERAGNRVLLSGQSYARDDGRLDVIARIRNDAPEDAEERVVLRVDGTEHAQIVSMAAWETTPFAFTIEPPRDSHGVLQIGSDVYPHDNTYHLYLGPPPPIRVLTLLSTRPSQQAAEETFFLRSALEAQTGSENLRFEMDSLPPRMIRSDYLDMANAVFVGGETAASEPIPWEELRRFSEDGGLLFVTLGNNALRVLRDLRAADLWDLRHGGRTGRELVRYNPYRIGSLRRGNPLADVFTGEAARDLYLSALYQYVRVEGAAREEVLLESEDGDPLLLRRVLGEGTLILGTFGLQSGDSDLPLRNAFLPLVQELFRLGRPEDGGIVHAETRSDVPGQFAGSGIEAGRFAAPGLIDSLDRPIVVNVSRTESDPEVLSERALHRRSDRSDGATDLRESLRYARPLWHWFALAAAAIFLLETLLGGWLDRRSSAPTDR